MRVSSRVGRKSCRYQLQEALCAARGASGRLWVQMRAVQKPPIRANVES
jgi:hypothetical protein